MARKLQWGSCADISPAEREPKNKTNRHERLT